MTTNRNASVLATRDLDESDDLDGQSTDQSPVLPLSLDELQEEQDQDQEEEEEEEDEEEEEEPDQSTYSSYYEFMRQTFALKTKISQAKLKRNPETHEYRVEVPLSVKVAANYRKAVAKVHNGVPSTESYMAQIRADDADLPLHQADATSSEKEFTFTTYDMMADVETKLNDMSIADTVKAEMQNLYAKACQQFKVLPCQYVMENVVETQLILRGRNIGDQGTKAVCVMLLSNSNIEQLDLSDCNIHDSGAVAIADLLGENLFITDLSLARNCFTSDGLRTICEALKSNKQIRHLDLSGLHLRDADSAIVEDLIEQSSSIRKFVLSHNDFSVDGGVAIARALLSNDHLEELDLSWNHLRSVGAVALANSLKKNSGIRVLDVSMNGFGEEGCVAFAAALPRNSYVHELNLAKNRISDKSLHALLYGLIKNESVTVVNLSSNPITPSAALSFIRHLLKAPSSCALRQVDLRDITVDQEFRDLAGRLQEERSITIQCGPVIRKAFDKRYEVTPVLMQGDPLKILFSFMKRENLRVTELFQTFIAANANVDQAAMRDRITRNAFINALRLVKVPLTNHQVDQLVRLLDADNDGFVSIADLMKVAKDYGRKEKERERKLAAKNNMIMGQPSKTRKELQTEFLTKSWSIFEIPHVTGSLRDAQYQSKKFLD